MKLQVPYNMRFKIDLFKNNVILKSRRLFQFNVHLIVYVPIHQFLFYEKKIEK